MPESGTTKTTTKWEGFGTVPDDNSSSTILTVDDNEAIRYTLVRSLREAGYTVIEARTGSEALVRAMENPDLITLDVNLPDIHGFDLCRQIKTNPATAHIPILHLSSTFVDPESRVHGLQSGADAYLAEPIHRAELVATIGALLRLKNAETQARQQAALAESARRELAQLNAVLEDRVRERTAELEAANQSLRELSARILQMQDDERRRIARELHDSVGQLLAAITMNNTAIQQESNMSPFASGLLRENLSMVEEILRSIRTISHLLHPPLLDEAGLPSALRWYVDEFSKRSGVKVNLQCDQLTGRLPGEVETAIFRVVQECLGNVHKHSSSEVASVRVQQGDEEVSLEVKDEGHGIPADKQRDMARGGGGVGLRGMRERVAQLGGELIIQSSAGGTTITAKLPCTPLEESDESEVA